MLLQRQNMVPVTLCIDPKYFYPSTLRCQKRLERQKRGKIFNFITKFCQLGLPCSDPIMRILTSRGVARVTLHQSISYVAVLPCYKSCIHGRFLHFLVNSIRLKAHPVFFKDFDIIMYAKLLLQRNNMRRPSEMKRSYIFRPTSLCETSHLRRAEYYPQLFLQARIPSGTFDTSFSNFLCLNFC